MRVSSSGLGPSALSKACLLAAAVTLAAVGACYVGPIDDGPGGAGSSGGTSGTPGSSGSPGSSGAAPGQATGLPCDVDALLAKRCRTCHVAGGPSPMPLVTYEDLTAPAKSDPTKKVAEISIARLRSTSSPMPPPPNERASDPEIAALETWVAGGLPRGTCGAPSGDGGPAAVTPTSVCTSGKTWSGKKGPSMQPGRACITCHEQEEDDAVVWIGGTVYPTIREPDGCLGINGGATVVVTDAKGTEFRLPVGATGNFSLEARNSAKPVFPIRAKVVTSDGKERVMTKTPSSGDCNACHTENGANGAPGRILAP